MALPPNDNWTDEEGRIFRTLQDGIPVDKRTDAERRMAPDTFVPTADRPVTISGAFISELIRKYMDEMPIGLQIKGVAIKDPINIENVRVSKMILLEHCHFAGPIIGRDCRVISFSLTGSVLLRYLDMRGAGVEGSLFLRWGFRSAETVLLRDARMTGTLDCDRASLLFDTTGEMDEEIRKHADGECFSFARGTASGLYWRNMRTRPAARVNLRNCRIGTLRDSLENVGDVERDWPPAGALRMSGLKYEERTSTNPDALLAWIKLQDRSENPYGSYQCAIKTLLDNGHDLAADKLILAKHRLLAKNDRNPINKFFRNAYIWLSHAGINTSRILIITVIFIAVSAVAVAALDCAGAFAPKSLDIVKNPCYSTSDAKCRQEGWVQRGDKNVPNYYPAFNALGFALDLSIPIVKFGASDEWRPASNRAGDVASWVVLAIRILGTVCWGLVGFCLTGLARFSR